MRILVIDDDPSVAEMIAEAIRTFGHEALVALDGAEGLLVLESYEHAVARAVVQMAALPLEANIPFMTIMATNMPLFGRG